jgi:hypothetical protein
MDSRVISVPSPRASEASASSSVSLNSARALPLLPEREGFHHGVFGVLKPARLDGLADERFLIWARSDVHVIKGSTARLRVKV